MATSRCVAELGFLFFLIFQGTGESITFGLCVFKVRVGATEWVVCACACLRAMFVLARDVCISVCVCV